MVQAQQQVVLKDLATPEGMAAISEAWGKEYSDYSLHSCVELLEDGKWVLVATLRRTPNHKGKGGWGEVR